MESHGNIKENQGKFKKKIDIFDETNTVTYFAFGIFFNRLLSLKDVLLMLIPM